MSVLIMALIVGLIVQIVLGVIGLLVHWRVLRSAQEMQRLLGVIGQQLMDRIDSERLDVADQSRERHMEIVALLREQSVDKGRDI